MVEVLVVNITASVQERTSFKILLLYIAWNDSWTKKMAWNDKENLEVWLVKQKKIYEMIMYVTMITSRIKPNLSSHVSPLYIYYTKLYISYNSMRNKTNSKSSPGKIKEHDDEHNTFHNHLSNLPRFTSGRFISRFRNSDRNSSFGSSSIRVRRFVGWCRKQ